MNSDKPPLSDAGEDAFALIETLHHTAQRLEELTAGEVDTVTDRDGRVLLLRRAQDYMRHNEASKQAAIIDALPAHIALLDSQGFIVSVNEAWRQFSGANAIQAPEYGIGVNYLEVCDKAQGDGASEAHQVAAGIRLVLAGEIKSFTLEYPCHSPLEQRWYLMTVTPLSDEHLHGVIVMHLNITERKAAEIKLQRHMQLYAALSQCNKAIVHCTNETELYLPICRVAVQFGGMQMAWVGLVDTDTRMVRPVASFGEGAEDLHDIEISIDADSPIGGGPTGTSIRTQQPYWCQDYQNDPATGPWRERATRAGWAASASLPLHCQGIVIGVFTLYSAKVNAFDESARDLLVEMAMDIGFALNNYAREFQRKRLEQEKEQYFKFFMLSTNPMCIADPYGSFKQVNPAFVQLTGYAESELVSKPFLDFILPEDRQSTADEMKLQVETRPSLQFENRFMRNDGTVIHLSWMGYFDRIDGVSYATATDITESRKSERRIAYLNRVYAMLSGINTLIVRVRDRDELFSEACRIAVEQGGFRMSLLCLLDRSTKKIVPVASAGKDEELMTAIRNRLSSSGVAPNSMVEQAIREEKFIISNDSQNDPRVLFSQKYAESGVSSIAVMPLMLSHEVVGVLVLYASEKEFFHEEELKLLTELTGDIAFAIDHIEKQERLDYLAYYDVLTGLANRSLFLERVSQYMRSAAGGGYKLVLFIIDLERFKNINDSLGRPAGDALLRQVVEWLTHNMGDVNLLARVDADHFAVVLPEIKPGDNIPQLLRKAMGGFLDHPFSLNDAVFRVSFKLGAALFPEDGTDAETLFKNAEAALKKAKASGEHYLFYAANMNEAVAGKLTLENQLRKALDNEEFVLHYQPKVNLASGRITSAEALIRWDNPQMGLVQPNRFIPILEETGMIYDVGRWAMRQVIKDYLRWRTAGLAVVRIAVNVSPLQLRNRGFIDEVKQKVGIDPYAAAGLELEITESLIMEDIKHNIASLQAIRDMGVTIAIDDFGTGFSSLSYLSKLPVDTLKIDRSFVIDMTASPEGLSLVSTIINLAHSLKLKVVAEGVETEEQSRLLRLLNCDEMQGFLFSKPVPGDIFETKYLTAAAVV